MRHTTTEHVDSKGHHIIVHTPVRTPEERAAWLAELDREIRRACPGWRLAAVPEKETADRKRTGRRRKRERDCEPASQYSKKGRKCQ